MSGLFVVTRDDPRDDRMLRAAEEEGSKTLRLPLLKTEAGEDGDRLLDWLADPPPHAAVALTSKRAGMALLTLFQTRGSSVAETLGGHPVFGVGTASAGPLLDAGIAVESVQEDPNAKRLAELILSRREALGIEIVAFLKGNRALSDLPEALRRGGLKVIEFELYRTRFEAPDVRPLVKSLESGEEVTVVFYSPSGVEALESLLHPQAVGALRASARAVSFGGTTRQTLTMRRYRRIASIEAVRPAIDPSAAAGLQSGEEGSR